MLTANVYKIIKKDQKRFMERRVREVSSGTKLVFQVMLLLEEKGVYGKGLEKLARACGISTPMCRNHVRSLEKLGMIENQGIIKDRNLRSTPPMSLRQALSYINKAKDGDGMSISLTIQKMSSDEWEVNYKGKEDDIAVYDEDLSTAIIKFVGECKKSLEKKG